MLSQTAESLFWIARNLERISTISRRLEVGYRLSMMPTENETHSSEWQSILETSGALPQFLEIYGEISQEDVAEFLLYDSRNPSSVKNCIGLARSNAKEVRTAITTDVWDAINYLYLEFNKFELANETTDLISLCEWVKQQTYTIRGAFTDTQLDIGSYDFYNLGHFVERAGNTARILDIKYHVLLPSKDMVGGSIDHYQWSSLLRALSSLRSFHWTYSGDYSPEKITDFLILNEACPRSIHHCILKINHHLKRLTERYGTYSSAYLHAAHMLEEVTSIKARSIITEGLHEYLVTFITTNNHLSDKIAESYLFDK